MDILAHGLWGGAGFVSRGPKKFGLAILFGMLPDLLSFGLFHASRPDWLASRIAGELSGPPPLSILPAYVFHAYNLTHSLVIWIGLFALVWALRKQPAWVLLAWGLHILCDIPTHNSRYFPTPYLWPLPTPYVEGVPWATPWFIAANYTALLAVYLAVFWVNRRVKPGLVGKEKK